MLSLLVQRGQLWQLRQLMLCSFVIVINGLVVYSHINLHKILDINDSE